jgi:acetyl-CoA C-acetyltransferase/acetyl-CoA acyltransferase 2
MVNQNENIVIVAAKRTAFGAFGGSLKNFSPTDLAVAASQGAIKQSGVNPEKIDHVIFGHVIQSTADSIYCPRHVALKVGAPVLTPALGVNRLCGSGFQSIANAAQMIMTGESELILAGGTESMSTIPYIVRGARFGYRMGPGEFEDYMTSALTDAYTGTPMAITAENLAEQFQISREEVDKYAYQSQQRCKAAQDKNLFAEEITPIEIKDKKGSVTFAKDEHPRPDTTLETLTKLKPVFKQNGVVTAGTASGITDGAAAVLVCSQSYAEKKSTDTFGKNCRLGFFRL